MAKEIERKFRLYHVPSGIMLGTGAYVEQGYLLTENGELRVRRKDLQCFLTVKGDGDLTRDEWEQEIPLWVFDTLWPATEGKRIEKHRYTIYSGDDYKLEIDEYDGALKELVTLECEFPSEEAAYAFYPPVWVGQAVDVTRDKRYKNKALAVNGLPKEDKVL